MVAINKADLVDEKTLAAVDERVRGIVPNARLLHTSHGRVPWSLVFADDWALTRSATVSTGLGGGRPAVAVASRGSLPDNTSFKLVASRPGGVTHGGVFRRCGDHLRGGGDHHQRVHPAAGKSALTEAFESASAVIEPPLSMDKLREVLRTLPRDIYRAKGLFHIDDSPERQLLIQLVGDRITAAATLPWGQKPRRSEVVVIGLRGKVSSGELLRLFEACAVAAERPRTQGLAARLTSWFRTRPLPGVDDGRKVATPGGQAGETDHDREKPASRDSHDSRPGS
jgi:G3E family GTPase